ncbi:MAG: TonB-dependent receptor [Pseudomonadota bacterium]|uniref:TonB-dependent receptor n=1 Tax=Phenylobacterium sp. TaxID=1871053 RepID=UPI0025D57DEF|nr:TonB-dependent receptor [Phenylobacterium sp.]MBT9471652.1 TonB-dependent receptor [Phenylobacterium sp.]
MHSGSNQAALAAKRRWALLCTASLASLCVADAAMAQASPSPTAIEEIVVTADRRSVSAQDVPATLTAVSGQTIAERHLDNMSEAIGIVPNVDIKQNAPGVLPVVTIRGVGLNDFGGNTSPPAGIYVDEIFLSTVVMMNGQLFDLDRVEVLKGPQGTLYGRNSTAGAINFISAPPTKEAGGRVQAGYGNYNTFTLDGMVNMPISDTLALRVSGKLIEQQDGYWKSRLLPGTIGKQSIQTGRAMLLWTPNDDYRSLLKVEGLRQRGQQGLTEFFGGVDPTTFGPCAALAAGRIDDTSCTNYLGYTDRDGDPYKGDWERKPIQNSDGWDATWRNDLQLGGLTLTSVTGYRSFIQRTDSNIDTTPAPILDYLNKYAIDQFSQEVRFGGKSGPLDWIVGGFYSWDQYTYSSVGQNRALFNTNTLITADQTTKSAAAFAHGLYSITPKLTGVLGLRYTWEERHYAGGSFDLNTFGASALCGGCAQPFPLAVVDQTISDKNVTGTVGLNYKPDDDSLIYASISQGQKSGGFFSGLATDPRQLMPYDPEKLTSYEVGVKLALLQRSLQVNVSGFYYDYRDIQTFKRSTAGFIPIQILGNVDKATVKGIDADVSWRPTQDLTLQAAVGILDSELGEFVNAAGVVQDGNKMPNAPAFSFKGSASYDVHLPRDYMARVTIQPSHASSAYRDSENTRIAKTPSYWTVDGNVLLSSAGSPWTFSVWGKNLTDEQYLTQVIDLTGLGFGTKIYSAPRTFGVTLGVAW